jgi:dethiobiotin synthetase/adenosylmethionine--8-amino-7-oxononanoate aminotransferase
LSGTSQLDAFRPLLPRILLIASSELGGISTTISSFESLLLRGYEIDHVLCFRETYYENYRFFEKYFKEERGIKVKVVDSPPERVSCQKLDSKNMFEYYEKLQGPNELQRVVETLQIIHEKNLENLKSSRKRSLDQIWWPFVQHGLIKNENQVMVIDSAHKDTFSVYNDNDKNESDDDSGMMLIDSVFDGSASWWTQCLGHANPELTLAAAHAAGRYGHVMFPTATNLPALNLVENLLRTVGKGWADRVFFSDNGSTGMEVGLKMAMRSFSDREKLESREDKVNLGVLGLKGSYHGDTIGAMDACQGGVYSERVEWYKGRGYWLTSPSLRIEKSKIVIRKEEEGEIIGYFDNLNQVYDVDTRVLKDPLYGIYRKEIEIELEREIEKRGNHNRFGTLVLEPVIMGAGGMIVVDPLYQRVLIDVVRNNRNLFPSIDHNNNSNSTNEGEGNPVWKGLPIIFDEVFTGLYRLGKQTSSEFLGKNCKPDISCFAKILTGGLVPMSVTMSSKSVFKSFYGENKVDALLHGHSYTAHPVGCGVANKTLEILERMDKKQQGNWKVAKSDWKDDESSSSTQQTTEEDTTSSSSSSTSVWSLWSREFVDSISHHPKIKGTVSLGTVLILHLDPSLGGGSGSGSGYTSTASESFLKKLRITRQGELFEGIHARPLGNVVYFMSSLNTESEMLRGVEKSILFALED